MIRMRFPLLVATFQLLACVHGALAATQTRAQEDSANASRRCSLGRKAQELSAAYAVRCAERFIVEQGYTPLSPTADTNALLPEGIEWSASRVEWLGQRKGTLREQAAGVCTDSTGAPSIVVFRATSGRGARGVTLDRAFGSLRVQHQDFRFEDVEKEQYGCRPLHPRTPP